MATEFRGPDVKAPRFRQESLNVISKEFCKKFREKHPKHKDISDSQIRTIIKAFNVPVSNNNWDTDGKLAKIFYSSYASKYKFAFRECWRFTACRNFKRKVAKTYPDNWTMYVQVDPNKKMRDIYTGITMKRKRLKEQAAQLKTYNEFDL